MKPETYAIDDKRLIKFVKSKEITDEEIITYKKVLDVIYEYHMKPVKGSSDGVIKCTGDSI